MLQKSKDWRQYFFRNNWARPLTALSLIWQACQKGQGPKRDGLTSTNQTLQTDYRDAKLHPIVTIAKLYANISYSYSVRKVQKVI